MQDVVGSLEWTAENFTYEDAILDNVYTNSSSIEESKNITVSDTLEQKATSIEITGQTYKNLVNGKATKNLLDEMSMQQTEGKPTQFTPHIEQPVCVEVVEGNTVQDESNIYSIGELQEDGTYKIDILTSDKNNRNSTQSILLPQPLNKIGNTKDKLYWDDDKGHYCIEQNFTKTVFDGSDDEGWKERYLSGNADKSRHCYNALNILVYPKFATTDNVVLCDKLTWRYAHNWGTTGVPIEDEFLINDNKFCVFKSSISTVSEFKKWISQNPITLIHLLETPIIIDLPDLNRKFSFDTYLPSTSVNVVNSLLQPYSLLLEADTVRYKSTIEPSTLYTIQFNCLAKSTTNLTLDLGGNRVTIDPIIGLNHVQITTPSELASDRLFLIGTGIIVKEVIVNKGNMNQYTKYFDGEQSVGELQEDGSYIIRISTDNYTNLWEGDLE